MCVHGRRRKERDPELEEPLRAACPVLHVCRRRRSSEVKTVVLLYSRGNYYSQHQFFSCSRKESGRNICIYKTESLCCVPETL